MVGMNSIQGSPRDKPDRTRVEGQPETESDAVDCLVTEMLTRLADCVWGVNALDGHLNYDLHRMHLWWGVVGKSVCGIRSRYLVRLVLNSAGVPGYFTVWFSSGHLNTAGVSEEDLGEVIKIADRAGPMTERQIPDELCRVIDQLEGGYSHDYRQ
jgi:hypothetical protein